MLSACPACGCAWDQATCVVYDPTFPCPSCGAQADLTKMNDAANPAAQVGVGLADAASTVASKGGVAAAILFTALGVGILALMLSRPDEDQGLHDRR